MFRLAAIATLIVTSFATALMADTPIVFKEDFNKGSLPDEINVSGDVQIDRSQAHGRGASMKLAPGSKATIRLSPVERMGRVQFWVYDDGAKPENIKAYHTGPRWGLLQKDGRVMVVGALYAAYLDGDNTYMAAYYSGQSWFGAISRLKGVGRSKGWHKWGFEMTPRGLTIYCDGKDVNSGNANYDWSKTEFTGIAGIVIFGDDKKGKHTIWVDDMAAALTSESTLIPESVRNMVPKADPIENTPAPMTDLLKNNVHPRLLLTARDVEVLKRYAAGPGKEWMDQLNAYARACTPPKSAEDVKFLRDATDGQRYGYWKMPTIALHYLLTGKKSSLENAIGFMKILLELPHWETTDELDSGMSAGNVMVGAGLAFDWLYDELDPEFREKFREKLIYQARAQYYGGHLMRAPNRVHYWQGDPQNNHRWHRNAGMTSCILAAYDGSRDQQWILRKVYEELAYVAKWLPEDGTSHESNSYMAFGGSHLMVAMQEADACYGTQYTAQPFFANQARFRLQLMLPGLTNSFEYGDSGGTGSYNGYLFKSAIDADHLDDYAGLLELARRSPNAFEWGWQNLIWNLPPTRPGNYRDMDKATFWPDMGIAIVRDGWEADNVAALFKCGPYGGYKLNEYRNENDYRYINVAHDDPDANMIQIAVDGKLLAETDRYSEHKYTSNYNTILINGAGQIQEADGFLQPTPGNGPHADMTKLAVVTGYLHDDGVMIVEGEAAGAYPAISAQTRWSKKPGPRPALDRYRRTVIWVKGKYLLVLDDIKAESRAEITWMMQAPEMTDLGGGRFRMARKQESGETARDFQLVADETFATEIVDGTADHRGRKLGHRQLRATVKDDGCRFVSVYNLWKVPGLSVTMRPMGSGTKEVLVTGDGINDRWLWNAPRGRFEASAITGKLSGGADVTFSSRNKAPTDGGPLE